MNPTCWPGCSLFANTVVITDTALTPAPCPPVSRPGAITSPRHTAACLYRKRKLHHGPPIRRRIHTRARAGVQETTVHACVRADALSNAIRAEANDARIMAVVLQWRVVARTKPDTGPFALAGEIMLLISAPTERARNERGTAYPFDDPSLDVVESSRRCRESLHCASNFACILPPRIIVIGPKDFSMRRLTDDSIPPMRLDCRRSNNFSTATENDPRCSMTRVRQLYKQVNVDSFGC